MIQEAIKNFNPKEKPKCVVCGVRDGWIFRNNGFVCGHPECMKESVEKRLSDEDILLEAVRIIEKKKAEEANSEISKGSML